MKVPILYSCCLNSTAEKLPDRSDGLGKPDALDADARRKGAQPAAGEPRVQHHEHAAIDCSCFFAQCRCSTPLTDRGPSLHDTAFVSTSSSNNRVSPACSA